MDEENNVDYEGMAKSIRLAVDGQIEVNTKVAETLVSASEASALTAKRVLQIDARLGEVEAEVRENGRKLQTLIDNVARILNVSTVDLEY